MTIDVVSPDPLFCHVLCEQKGNREGVDWPETSLTFASLEDARASWALRSPETVILDAQVLGGEVARVAGLAGGLAPSVLLFVLGMAEQDLDAPCAVEFFVAPVKLGHVLARWRFHHQRKAAHRDAVFVLGPWRFLPGARQLIGEDTGVLAGLTEKENMLLTAFCQAEEPLSRGEILETVWGYDGRIDTHTFETHLYRLRSKLMSVGGARPDGDAFLVENGRYRLNPAWTRP